MMDSYRYKINSNQPFNLDEFSTRPPEGFNSKKKVGNRLNENIEEIVELQAKLYAQNDYAILLIFQAMDTAGKDGLIKHVMSGLNPQGTQVHDFKVPSQEELNHDYLWRAHKHLPERGQIGIFNRSYYEEVLVVRVHDLVKNQKIPPQLVGEDIWTQRYLQIRNYEKYLVENGIQILKFFLHLSKAEQKKRLLERIENPSKNWKFSQMDIKERAFWDQYQKCYGEAIAATSTDYAPWYVVPADKKWFTRWAVSEIIVEKLKALKLSIPLLHKKQRKILEEYKRILLQD